MTLAEKLEHLPAEPGVYQYFGTGRELLYVGKAKSLRSRVRSYFQPSAQHTARTAALVAEIEDLEIIVVDTELEALLLEANLIRRHRPRYNVVLRDDKSFPYLKLSTGDVYPRLSLVRRARLDGHRYYGPFTPSIVAHRTLKLVPRFFQVATCAEVFDGKRRPCLYYHLDQCLAPCAGKTTPAEYGKAVEDARLFLEGRDRELAESLTRRMREASDVQEFERAARYRDTLDTVRRLSERQRMASAGLEDQDYFADHREGPEAVVEMFQVREGKMVGRREFSFAAVEAELAGLYAAVIAQYYLDVEPPAEIFVPVRPESCEVLEHWLSERRGRRVDIRTPLRGPKRKLLEMARKNAALAFEGRFRARHTHGVAALESLAEALGLDEPPARIECFDISNLHGTDSVASMVVWENGEPRKSDYRVFGIRAIRGPDDFAAIAEAVTRRYRRVLAEGRRMPDLVLIDGGAGQLGAAVRSLAAVGLPTIPVVAIAKREEELHLQGGAEPVRLDRASPALRLIQRIRDEAHRFALAHHRRRRSRRTLATQLTEIPGIGPVTARKLLMRFGSLDGVRRAPRVALEEFVGRRVAEALAERFGTPRNDELPPV